LHITVRRGIVTRTGFGRATSRGRLPAWISSRIVGTASRPRLSIARFGYTSVSLSYRDVEDLLAERGLEVSYETVRRCRLEIRARARE
jgi:hypothetical protein